MNKTKHFLNEQTPFVKMFALILLILVSAFFVFFIGVLIAMPVFGTDILTMLTEAGRMESPQDIAIMKYFQVVSQLGIFIIPALIFPLLTTPLVFNYLKLDKTPGMVAVIAAILLVFSILPGINWLMQINEALTLPGWMSGIESWMRQSEAEAARLTEAFLKTDSIAGLLFNILMIAVLAAVGEELLFRGVLIRLFNEWFKNIHIAVLVSAILFSMFHLQFFGFFPRLLLGIIFGYLFVWSGSLWLPILAHFVNNGAAVMIYYFYNRGSIQTDAEDFGTTDSSVLFALSILLSVGLMVLIFLKEKQKSAVL